MIAVRKKLKFQQKNTAFITRLKHQKLLIRRNYNLLPFTERCNRKFYQGNKHKIQGTYAAETAHKTRQFQQLLYKLKKDVDK